MHANLSKPTRRQLLTAVGVMGGSSILYQAMTTLGHATETQFAGPPNLSGARPGTSVVVLGAGLAGMLAAYELTKAGYKVRILEYQSRAGGRNWSLYGGDTYTELGGATQKVAFQSGNYLNPGPWRIPFHHRTLLHYCRAFGVALEPFIQFNHNTFVHNTDAFGGKPQRFNALAADYEGHVAEFLGKAIDKKALDEDVKREDLDRLKEALREWGTLDRDMKYTKGLTSSEHRGFARPPGGGVNGAPLPSDPFALDDILDSQIWRQMAFFMNQEFQTTMFQPVGGMGMIGKAFARQVEPLLTYGAKVTRLMQDKGGVTVSYTDVATGTAQDVKADYCVCTIPLGVLNQIGNNLSPQLREAISAVPYTSAVKVGLEMRRRFWEEEDYIYGGHSFTTQEISLVSYPNYDYFSNRPAVLLGAFAYANNALRLTGLSPAERVEVALKQGSVFHPKGYRENFMNGASVAWSRVPWTLGCCAKWTEETRKKYYQTLVGVDDRVVLAGEHASYAGCWMEGALLSSIDAITRLHKRAQEA